MELKFNDARVTYTPPQAEVAAYLETSKICQGSIEDPDRKKEQDW